MARLIEVTALMIMRHHSLGDAPEPLDTVSIRIKGRCVCQVQVLFQFGQHTAHEQKPSRGVRLQIVGKHNSDVPRRVERATAARTCSQNTSAVRPGATWPSNQPSRQSTRPKP